MLTDETVVSGAMPLAEHTLVCQPADDEEVQDLYFVLGCKPVLEAYVKRLHNVAAKNLADALIVEEEVVVTIADPTKLAASVATDGADKPKLMTNSMDDGDPPADKAGDAVKAVKEAMANAKASGSSKPTAFDIGSVSKPLSTLEAQIVAATLEKLIFFSTKCEEALPDPFSCEGLPRPARQKLLREQGLGELLVRVLQAPFLGPPAEDGSSLDRYDWRHSVYNSVFVSIDLHLCLETA